MSKKDKNEATANEQVDEQIVDKNEETSEDTRTVEEQLNDALALEKDKFLRLFAEFENYKRRTAKERIDLFKTASQELMVALLPVLDDFDRAYAEISKTEEKDLLKGVELIRNKFKNTLENKGLELVDLQTGDDFNPDNHEAITQIPAPNKALKGKIIDVVEQGYKLGDKIIRFPKVVIGQ